MSDIAVTILTAANIKFLIWGAIASVGLAIGAFAMGLTLGLIGAAARISKNKIANVLAYLYVTIIRGTPMLLQIYFLFLAVPSIYSEITGEYLDMHPLVIGLLALGINCGAYTTELLRGGIQSIDKGQWEASKTLGLNYFQTMKLVIIPQTFKRVLPPLASEFIVLIKDSSLVSIIGAAELMKNTKTIGARYYNYVIPLICAGVLYLVLTIVVQNIAYKIEKRLALND